MIRILRLFGRFQLWENCYSWWQFAHVALRGTVQSRDCRASLTLWFDGYCQRQSIQGIIPDLLSWFRRKADVKFSYHLVPKIAEEALFETGHADLLITAVRTARRDQFGEFVSLIQLRATLISIESGQPSITSSAELLHVLRLNCGCKRI